MTLSVAEARPRSNIDQGLGPQWSEPEARPAAVRDGFLGVRASGVRAGQIVATQAALAALLAALGRGPLVGATAVMIAAVLVLGAWVRVRRRWLFEWLAVGLRYLTRRRRRGVVADPVGLLDLVTPAARVLPATLAGDPAAVISDGYGLTALLELGDPAGLLNDAPQPLPAPASLLPAVAPHVPPIRIQLLLTAAPAPAPQAGGNHAATSYRQLTEGRGLGHEQAVLAVRVLHTEGWSSEDLLRSLSSILRKVRRRLAPVPARLLGESAALRVLAETAGLHGAQSVHETWPMVRMGGLVHASFRLWRWPDLRVQTAQRLVPRLLALPAAATTVSLSAGHGADASATVGLTVRLTADTPTTLATAGAALYQLLQAERAVVRRLDGEQLMGLAATLPLGLDTPGRRFTAPDAADGFDLPMGTAGLMIGANRHGEAVMVRLFRTEATRAMLIGGVRAAQIVTLRALALGARVVVQTTRPAAWEPFVRGATAPGGAIAVIPPGRVVEGPPATPLHPLLIIVDVGPVAPDPQPGPGWQAQLVVRDGLAHADLDFLARADLALLQPLRPEEATLAGTALGLGTSAAWLTRIRHDMLAVVNRRALRWALLSITPIESQLIGPPIRP